MYRNQSLGAKRQCKPRRTGTIYTRICSLNQYAIMRDATPNLLRDERQPSWPVPTTTLAGGAGRKTGMPVWRAAPPA
jgi:hypothetical protein